MVNEVGPPGRPFGPSGTRYRTGLNESVNQAARFVTTTSLTKLPPPESAYDVMSAPVFAL